MSHAGNEMTDRVGHRTSLNKRTTNTGRAVEFLFGDGGQVKVLVDVQTAVTDYGVPDRFPRHHQGVAIIDRWG